MAAMASLSSCVSRCSGLVSNLLGFCQYRENQGEKSNWKSRHLSPSSGWQRNLKNLVLKCLYEAL